MFTNNYYIAICHFYNFQIYRTFSLDYYYYSLFTQNMKNLHYNRYIIIDT